MKDMGNNRQLIGQDELFKSCLKNNKRQRTRHRNRFRTQTISCDTPFPGINLQQLSFLDNHETVSHNLCLRCIYSHHPTYPKGTETRECGSMLRCMEQYHNNTRYSWGQCTHLLPSGVANQLQAHKKTMKKNEMPFWPKSSGANIHKWR